MSLYLFPSYRAGGFRPSHRRVRAARHRLDVARRGYERSLRILRDAAFASVDRRDLDGLTLRLWLDRCLGPQEQRAA